MTRLLGDRYELRRRLWSGELTEAHEAQDLKRNERVVVELLQSRAAQDSQNVALFKLAFRTAAGLRHPHIQQVTYAEQVEGYHLVTRELLQGRTLHQTIETSGPLDPERALSIAIEAGEALAHAHRSGTAHGELTPDTIHLGPTGHVMLTGFGLSARSAAGIDPQFAAPERQNLRQANPACDVYALGRCLQFMLTGEAPNRDLPDDQALLNQPALDAVLRRMLAREPSERHVTMPTATDDLRRCLESDLSVSARVIKPDAVIPPPPSLRPPPDRRPPSGHPADDGAAAHANAPAGELDDERHWRRRLLVAAACCLMVVGGWTLVSDGAADERSPAGEQAQTDVMTESDEMGSPAPIEVGRNSPSTTGSDAATTTRPGDSSSPDSPTDGTDTPGTSVVAGGSTSGGGTSDGLLEGDSMRPSSPSGTRGTAPTSTSGTPTSSTPTTQARTTTVPNVVSMTEQQAVDTLEASGLQAGVSRNCLLCVLGCEVTAQNPRSGAQAVVGSTVDLTITCL